jgi:hypothetical protein
MYVFLLQMRLEAETRYALPVWKPAYYSNLCRRDHNENGLFQDAKERETVMKPIITRSQRIIRFWIEGGVNIPDDMKLK